MVVQPHFDLTKAGFSQSRSHTFSSKGGHSTGTQISSFKPHLKLGYGEQEIDRNIAMVVNMVRLMKH